MKLYFVRHGESEANQRREFSNRGLKHGLTEVGRRQALALAQTLQNASITQIFSSPLLRAVQTTHIVAQVLGVPYQVTDALREIDCGILEGKSDDASWQAFWQLCESWLKSQAWTQRVEQGENFLDLQQRFVPFVKTLAEAHRSAMGGLLFVGHGGLYRCMLPQVFENIAFDYGLEHGLSHTATIVAEVRATRLVCLSWDGVLMTAS